MSVWSRLDFAKRTFNESAYLFVCHYRQYITGKQCLYVKFKYKILLFVFKAKQSSLVSFYAVPFIDKLKGVLVH